MCVCACARVCERERGERERERERESVCVSRLLIFSNIIDLNELTLSDGNKTKLSPESAGSL